MAHHVLCTLIMDSYTSIQPINEALCIGPILSNGVKCRVPKKCLRFEKSMSNKNKTTGQPNYRSSAGDRVLSSSMFLLCKCTYNSLVVNFFKQLLSLKLCPSSRSLIKAVGMARPGNKIIQAKLVLLGDMGTGKTSLVLRFVKGQFFDHQEPTIGAAFFTQILSLSEATVKFDIWDTAGQERYHSLAPMYYRGAAAAVVVYDISSTDTYTRAKKWVQELQRQGNLNLVMALVANKSDLEAKREVDIEEGEQFAQDNGMFYMETSAKTSQNVNELFHEIAKRLARACPSKPSGMTLNNETRDRRRKSFCCLG